MEVFHCNFRDLTLIRHLLALIGLNEIYKYTHLIASIHFLLIKLEPTEVFHCNFRDIAVISRYLWLIGLNDINMSI